MSYCGKLLHFSSTLARFHLNFHLFVGTDLAACSYFRVVNKRPLANVRHQHPVEKAGAEKQENWNGTKLEQKLWKWNRNHIFWSKLKNTKVSKTSSKFFFRYGSPPLAKYFTSPPSQDADLPEDTNVSHDNVLRTSERRACAIKMQRICSGLFMVGRSALIRYIVCSRTLGAFSVQATTGRLPVLS